MLLQNIGHIPCAYSLFFSLRPFYVLYPLPCESWGFLPGWWEKALFSAKSECQALLFLNHLGGCFPSLQEFFHIHKLISTQLILKRDLLVMSVPFSLHSSLLSSTHANSSHLGFPRLSALSPQHRESTRLFLAPYPEPWLEKSLQIVSQDNSEFTLFVSHFLRITVFHCPVSSALQTDFSPPNTFNFLLYL